MFPITTLLGGTCAPRIGQAHMFGLLRFALGTVLEGCSICSLHGYVVEGPVSIALTILVCAAVGVCKFCEALVLPGCVFRPSHFARGTQFACTSVGVPTVRGFRQALRPAHMAQQWFVMKCAQELWKRA